MELRYQLQRFPENEDCLQININYLLIVDKKINFVNAGLAQNQKYLTHFGKKIVPEIFAIEGIEELAFTPYSINLSKGGVFTWDAIISSIISNLQLTIGGEKKVKVTKLPGKFNKSEAPLIRRNLLRDDCDEDHYETDEEEESGEDGNNDKPA
jgi:hypothetical protein